MGKITSLCILIATVMGIVTFSAKQKVMNLECHLAGLNRKILELRESRRTLDAEWAWLNEPGRLQRLVERHLNINAGRGSTHLVSLENLAGGATRAPYDGDAMVRLASALEGSTHEKPVQ